MLIEMLKIAVIFFASWFSFAGVAYLLHRRRIKKEFEELIKGPTLVPDIVYPNESRSEDLSRNRLVYDRKTKKWIKLREID